MQLQWQTVIICVAEYEKTLKHKQIHFINAIVWKTMYKEWCVGVNGNYFHSTEKYVETQLM